MLNIVQNHIRKIERKEKKEIKGNSINSNNDHVATFKTCFIFICWLSGFRDLQSQYLFGSICSIARNLIASSPLIKF